MISMYKDFMKVFVDRENKIIDNNFRIGGMPAYDIVRRYLAVTYLSAQGVGSENVPPFNGQEAKKNYIKSFVHLAKLMLPGHRYDNLIYSFYRVEKVDGLFLDKFTDPLIDYSVLGRKCVIFEPPKEGLHSVPRAHSASIAYTDSIGFVSKKLARYFLDSYYKKHENEFAEFEKMVDELMCGIEYDKKRLVRMIYRFIVEYKLYKCFLRKLKVKRIVAPCKPSFMPLLYAAKKQHVCFYEVQHGICHHVGITTSRTVNEDFVPDWFLSYGDLEKPELYGVPKDRIINIGWAFGNYVKDRLGDFVVKKNTVLIISNPLSTRRMFEVVFDLAQKNPNVYFEVRPHPTEIFPDDILETIGRTENVNVQDNKQNYLFILPQYESVMGDNSTALDEALSYGKKVGHLKYEGFTPIYANEKWKKMSWEIYDDQSFRTFFEAPMPNNGDLNIYSPFNVELANKIFNS